MCGVLRALSGKKKSAGFASQKKALLRAEKILSRNRATGTKKHAADRERKSHPSHRACVLFITRSLSFFPLV